MKTILILMFSGWTLFAQTTNSNQIANTNELRTVLVTNWVEPGPYLRVVNGQTYNTAYSKLWGDPIKLSPRLPILANNGHPIRYELVTKIIRPDKIYCDVDAITWWPETWTAKPQDEDRQTIKTVAIFHYPNQSSLVTGEPFSCVCMRIGNYQTNGFSYEAFDCGVQATNLVPVVKKVKIKQ